MNTYKKIMSGQSMFEVMIALAVTAIILTALITLSTKSVTNTDKAGVMQSASLYAQEASEWIRRERDGNWEKFLTYADGTTEYCISDLSQGITTGTCPMISGTILTRTAVFTLDTPLIIRVLIKVYWNDKVGYHEERVVTNLTNWKNSGFLPTPTP